MGDFVKELTIIDFLGILLPGTVLILLFSADFTLMPLWEGYFGAACGEGVKAVFLLVGGYAVGMLIHEVGDLLEKGFLWKFYYLNPMIRASREVGVKRLAGRLSSWCERFQMKDLKVTREKRPNEMNMVKWIAKQIKQLIRKRGEEQKAQQKEQCEKRRKQVELIKQANAMIQTRLVDAEGKDKRRLFDGFHIMARNFVLVCIVLLLYLGLRGLTGFPSQLWVEISKLFVNAVACVIVIAVCLSIFLLLVWRSQHYAFLKYKYSYETFIKIVDQGNPVRK